MQLATLAIFEISPYAATVLKTSLVLWFALWPIRHKGELDRELFWRQIIASGDRRLGSHHRDLRFQLVEVPCGSNSRVGCWRSLLILAQLGLPRIQCTDSAPRDGWRTDFTI
jgi:hypothetical protein